MEFPSRSRSTGVCSP